MTDLYARILLWHKLVAQQTGGLSLCSAKHRLNRAEAQGWSAMFRSVADDIDQFLLDGTFVLDTNGQRVVGSQVLKGTGHSDLESMALVGDLGPKGVAPPLGGTQHVEQSQPLPPISEPVGRKAGGLRVARRKT